LLGKERRMAHDGKSGEGREHLLKTVCRNIINNPRRVDADAVEAFKAAARQYAELKHITPDTLYQSDGEVGIAVRGAWDVLRREQCAQGA
jgi:hypothetical protein